MEALKNVKILDFTHVQSGPTCTQLLAWFGADVIKVERPGVGDATRKQLVDVPGADSLYFTMLNHNKRSITLNTKDATGKGKFLSVSSRNVTCWLKTLLRRTRPHGLWLGAHPGAQPAHDHGLGQRIWPRSLRRLQGHENVAQCTGGSASTTGFLDGRQRSQVPRSADSGTGLHLALGIVTALYQREQTGRGQKVLAAMQDGVLNLCRVKLRDQQRLKAGPLKEYSQFGQGIEFGDAAPRAGNDSGGGQPGWILKCKGWETDPNAYVYFITQAAVWGKICDLIGQPDWKDAPGYAKPDERLDKIPQIFDRIEEWTKTKTKREVMDACNPLDIPCGPILSMKELAEEPSLRETGTIVEVDHPERGPYLTVGCPVKLSDSPADVKRSPLLGEHTAEVLRDVLGYQGDEFDRVVASGAVGDLPAEAAE